MQIFDLRAYRAMVVAALSQARAEGKAVTFSNTGPAHAAVVLEVMVDASSRTLDVISGVLDKAAWSPDSLHRFLQGKGRLRILLDEVPDGNLPPNSAALDLLKEGADVEIKCLPKPLGMHLCIADGEHIRLEHQQKTCEATVTFGDKKFGSLATQVFENAWTKVAVPLRQLEPA